jgi:hypothetical protein
MTGNPELDFVLEAGPRAFTPAVSASVRLEIAKSSELGPYRDSLKLMAQNELALLHHEIEQISRENHATDWKASKIGVPYARFPPRLIEHFKMLYGEACWPDDEFIEDILKHHPGLRVKVKYGTKGQEYVK